MRNNFDKQLDQLHVELIKMGSLCEEAISISARVLLGEQEDREGKTASLEREIDQLEHDIETRCMRLLLQQQPVASDLRTVSAALKMISDMERIGDQAADIAELAPYVVESAAPSKSHIMEMAYSAVSMVTDSVEAFVRSDLELAKQVIKADDTVDSLFSQVKSELTAMIRENEIHAEVALDLMMAAKYFERIGDHAVNLAEAVEYSITGIRKKDAYYSDL